MKYRIVQLRNQSCLIQKKLRWYYSWDNIAYPVSLDRARELMNEIISDMQHDELKKQGQKIAKIIEEFEV